MKKLIYFFSLMYCLDAQAQQAYTDSLLAFQDHYKKDLSLIIQHDTSFVRFYPANNKFLVQADIEILKEEKFFSMPTSGEVPKDAIRFARLLFTLNGKTYTVYAYRLAQLMANTEYRNYFFIPFTDSTSGRETYGGGRYLDFRTTDITADMKLEIDFNKAYNPYCAFVTGFNCPIPPKENDLPASIRAGEMKFVKEHQ